MGPLCSPQLRQTLKGRKEGQTRYSDMSCPPPGHSLQELSLLRRHPHSCKRNTPFSSILICFDRGMAMEESHASQSRMLCRNARAILGLSADSGGSVVPAHVPAHAQRRDPRGRSASHPTPDGSLQGQRPAPCLGRQFSQPC